MSTLFSQQLPDTAPLAEKLRPTSIAEVMGQGHVLDGGHMLNAMLEENKAPESMILWGPPGCGKTTLAKIIASESGYELEVVSAVASGVAELKEMAKAAGITGISSMKKADLIEALSK